MPSVRDVMGLAGLVMLGGGLWMWWPAGALMICGGILLGLAVVSAIWSAYGGHSR